MKTRSFDYWILFPTLILMALGAAIVYSASSGFAISRGQSGYLFLKKNLLFSLIGVGLMVLFSRINYRYYWKVIYPFMGLAILLCVMVFIPGVGTERNHATRWLALGGFTFQPSELVKIAFIFFMAYSLTKKREKIEQFSVGVLPNAIILAVLMVIIHFQRDFGTIFILTVLFMILLFVGGTRTSYFAGVGLLTIPMFYFFIYKVPFRWARVEAWLNPWLDPKHIGYQPIQSSIAFLNGGFWGLGLGKSIQKQNFLKESHTDFILAIVGEELGLVGVLCILILFTILVIRGLQIALSTQDLFGKYVALGISALIAVQSMINCAVAMSLIPTKGLTLPFVSYGGTSLLVMSMAVGILLNISSQVGSPAMDLTDFSPEFRLVRRQTRLG